MTRIVFTALILLLLAACGKQTELSIEDIRFRLEVNKCRAVLDKTAYEIGTWEYRNEQRINSSEMLWEALPESLLVCPVTLERYVLVVEENAGSLSCPSGHGSVDIPRN
jgi:hypothetical protein